jgi:hypothetical protein
LLYIYTERRMSMAMLRETMCRVRFVPLVLLLTVALQQAVAGPTTFVSDDFNSHNLKRPLWTYVDPNNDAAIKMTGVNTGDADFSLMVPGGSAHDLWTNGYGVPRILQPAANEDFNLEAKFTSSLNGVIFETYAAQGVIVEADASNLIRFDFTTGNEDSTKAFAAVFAGGFASPDVKINKNIGVYGIAPLYLRVHRSGNSWTMLYSFDGSTYDTAGTFSHTLTVAKVGLFSANAGPTPSPHSAVVDYFFNMDSVIASEDGDTGVVDNLTPLIHSVRVKSAPDAFRVTWQTDEPTDGVVEFGTVLPYSSSVSHPGYFYDHRLTVPGLSANTLYNYRVNSTDLAALTGQTGNATVSTGLYVDDSTTVSDDYHGPTLDGSLWTFINPRGDAAQTITDGQLSIAIPGGIEHDPWTNGNLAPRALQPFDVSTNVTEVSAKFTSNFTGSATSFAIQGIMFVEDSLNYLRFDVSNNGTQTSIFIGSFVDGFSAPDVLHNSVLPPGGPPIYLRVGRGGALWTLSYSYNGTDWTEVASVYRVLDATQVGVFGGNAGSSPQPFTCLVDFFQAPVPAKSMLLSPANGAPAVSLPALLTWDTTAGATSHRLQVSTVANFATTVFDSIVLGTSKTIEGLAGTTLYYWRVRGHNNGKVGEWSNAWNFTSSVGAPGAPTLVSPAADATEVSTNPTFLWNMSAGATSYRLQVGTDSTFAGGIAFDDSTVTDTTKAVTGLAGVTKHYWRVSAKNAGGTSAFSAVRGFTTAPPTPVVPTLLAPANGAVDQPADLTVSWNVSAGADMYHLQLGTDSLFTGGLVVNDSTLVDTTKAVSGLAYNTGYFWRVRAKNAGGYSSYSSTWGFMTAGPPPGSPSLVAPPNGSVDQPTSLPFVWTRPAGATSFRLQVTTDSTFMTGFVVNDSTIVDTSKVVSGLAFNQKYFWRVGAQNAGGAGPYSPVWNLTTLTSDPSVPVQLEPLNGASDQPRDVTFRWTRPAGATSFRLQVTTDSTFSGGFVVDDATITDTLRAVTGLDYLTTYYWRINADNVGGTSPWSSVWAFSVGIPLPDPVQLVSPAPFSTTPSGDVSFVWRQSQPQVTRYWFELSIDSAFAFRTVDSTLTDTLKLISGLSGQTYFWRVRAGNGGGWGPYSETRNFTVIITDVGEVEEIPTEYALNQNYPNPFNPTTEIRFALPEAGQVRLTVYNLLGEEIATLVDQQMGAGFHTVRYDAGMNSSGLYLYRLEVNGKAFTRKMMLVK